MYKSGFVENISDLWINGNIHQRRDCVFRESSELFFLEWWQWIHTEPLTAFLFPSLWPKDGRWKMAGQGSGCSLLPWNYSRMVEKHYSGSPASWLYFFKEMHRSDKERTLNYTKIYWLGNMKNIICRNPGYTFPLHRYRCVVATTWASRNPRSIHLICWTAKSQGHSGFLQIIFFTLPAQRRKMCICINSC